MDTKRYYRYDSWLLILTVFLPVTILVLGTEWLTERWIRFIVTTAATEQSPPFGPQS